MEYVFGHHGDYETLQTKGDSHTNLKGFHRIDREYPDQRITDEFRIVDKIWSAKDSEGKCYDRYKIDKHFRVTDKAEAINKRLQSINEAAEEALCELDMSIEERIAAIEEALCELDDMIRYS